MEEGTEAIHEALAIYGWGRPGITIEKAARALLRELQQVVAIEVSAERKKPRRDIARAV